MTAADRNRQLGWIHAARRDMAFDEDTYRAILGRVTGKRSAKDLVAGERQAVLQEFRRLGWRPKRRTKTGRRRAGPDARLSKARAIWRSLWCLGEVHDESDVALARFAARMTASDTAPDGIQRLAWLDGPGWERVFRALRGWCKRAGYLAREADGVRINAERAEIGLPAADEAHVAKIVLVERLAVRASLAGLPCLAAGEASKCEPEQADAMAREFGSMLREARA